MLTSERASNQALQRRFGYGLDLVSLLTPSGESWYHHDGLGSVQHLTNPGGQAEWDYDYDAYGQLIEHAQLRSDAPANPMRYTGEYADPTGLHHLRARQYDPAIGRFTQTDPAPAELGDSFVAAYVYTRNQPTRYTDPSGKVTAECTLLAYPQCFAYLTAYESGLYIRSSQAVLTALAAAFEPLAAGVVGFLSNEGATIAQSNLTQYNLCVILGGLYVDQPLVRYEGTYTCGTEQQYVV